MRIERHIPYWTTTSLVGSLALQVHTNVESIISNMIAGKGLAPIPIIKSSTSNAARSHNAESDNASGLPGGVSERAIKRSKMMGTSISSMQTRR